MLVQTRAAPRSAVSRCSGRTGTAARLGASASPERRVARRRPIRPSPMIPNRTRSSGATGAGSPVIAGKLLRFRDLRRIGLAVMRFDPALNKFPGRGHGKIDGGDTDEDLENLEAL